MSVIITGASEGFCHFKNNRRKLHEYLLQSIVNQKDFSYL